MTGKLYQKILFIELKNPLFLGHQLGGVVQT